MHSGGLIWLDWKKKVRMEQACAKNVVQQDRQAVHKISSEKKERSRKHRKDSLVNTAYSLQKNKKEEEKKL